MNIMNFIIAISAGYLLFSGLVLNTKNFASALYFKVTPFILGVGLLVTSLKNYGVI